MAKCICFISQVFRISEYLHSVFFFPVFRCSPVFLKTEGSLKDLCVLVAAGMRDSSSSVFPPIFIGSSPVERALYWSAERLNTIF